MAIGDEGLIESGKKLKTVILDSLKKEVDEDSEIISIYTGEDLSEKDGKDIAEKIEKEFPDVEVEINYGGQPVYYCLISIE